ncbi:hypothetical protein ACQ4M3_02245 [Leptolyngbya sp. AN03gr2]
MDFEIIGDISEIEGSAIDTRIRDRSSSRSPFCLSAILVLTGEA